MHFLPAVVSGKVDIIWERAVLVGWKDTCKGPGLEASDKVATCAQQSSLLCSESEETPHSQEQSRNKTYHPQTLLGAS